MFVPEVWLFPSVYWFVNFTRTDKHGTKIRRDLSALETYEGFKPEKFEYLEDF